METTTFSDDFTDGQETAIIPSGWSNLNAEQRATLWVCEGLEIELVQFFYATVSCA